VGRWGGEILTALAQAQALPEDALPELPRSPRPPMLSGIARRRIELLRTWRAEAAPAADLDPGVLLPNRLIRAIAEAGPRDRPALARVEGVRQWRVDVFGAGILAALQ
jgi:ribonuclease D